MKKLYLNISSVSGFNKKSISASNHLFAVCGLIDKNSDFDDTNDRFVAPVTGTYLLNTQIRFDNQDSAASYYQLHIITSNRDYSLTIDPEGFDSNNSYWTEGLSVIADMDASDTATIKVRQQGGSAQTDIDYGGSSWFSGHLLS